MIQEYKIITTLTIFAWITLALFLVFSPDCFIADEDIYYQNLYSPYFHFSYQYIQEYKGTSGIISTWFNLLILPITNGDIVKMRIFNFIWLFLTAFILNIIIQKKQLCSYKYAGYLLIFLPHIFEITGRVMGDFPAFFLALFFYYLVQKLQSKPQNIILYSITGLIGSLAISGKQTLIFLLIFPLYAIWKNKNDSIKYLIMIVIMLSLPLTLYYIWGGFLPKSSGLKIDLITINFVDFLYVFVYVRLLGLTIDKTLIERINFKKIFLNILTIFTFHLIVGIIVPFPFFKNSMALVRESNWFVFIDYFWSVTMIFLSFLGVKYFYSIVKENYKKKNLSLIVFIIMVFLIFLKTPYFTGRYLAIIAPFLFLALFNAKKIALDFRCLIFGFVYNLFLISFLYFFNDFYPLMIFIKKIFL